MNDITALALLVSKAKASVFTMKYISQFEADDIDSDDVDLRFEVDGVETDTNVSIVDECGQAAQMITALVEALEKALRSNEYLREQSAEWERKAISNFEECAEMSARIEELESQRKLAFTAGNRWADKFREAEKRIAELEAREVILPSVQDVHPLWPQSAKIFCEFHRSIVNRCADEIRKVGFKVSIKGN